MEAFQAGAAVCPSLCEFSFYRDDWIGDILEETQCLFCLIITAAHMIREGLFKTHWQAFQKVLFSPSPPDGGTREAGKGKLFSFSGMPAMCKSACLLTWDVCSARHCQCSRQCAVSALFPECAGLPCLASLEVPGECHASFK